MRFLLVLAFRNLSRYRRRTLITAGAIAVGLAIFILLDSLLVGAELESERNLIWYETSSARIMHPDYWDERERSPLRHVVEDPGVILSALKAERVPATARTVFAGELIVWRDPFPEDGSLPVRIFAVDPQTDDSVYRFRDTVVAGRYLEPGEEGVMLGAWLAEDLGAEVGYPVIISARSRYGARVTIDADVVGILNSPNPTINRGGIFIPLDIADLYLDMNGAVTQIDMHLPETIDADLAVAQLRGLPEISELSVKSWRELASDYVALAKQKAAGSGVIMLLVFVIAAVGVSNTMLMTIFERIREIGMMRALGMEERKIQILFLLEAAGIGLVGSMAGVVIGVLGNIPVVRIGIDYSRTFRAMDAGYRTAGILYGAWLPGTIITAFVAGILLAVIIAIVPTRRALRMDIPQTLRHQ